MSQTVMPRMRERDLVIREGNGEAMVLDRNTRQTHCLDGRATAVWKACDGTNTVQDISEKSSTELGVTEALLQSLSDIKLLVK